MRSKIKPLMAYMPTIFLLTPLLITTVLQKPALSSECSGNSCTGKDPEKMGCAKDQQLVDEVLLKNGKGEQVGFIDLKYSPTCKAYWAKLVNEKFWAPMSVSIFHYKDGNWAANPVTTQSNSGGTEEYSLMSPHLNVKGCGRLTLTTSGTVEACTQSGSNNISQR